MFVFVKQDAHHGTRPAILHSLRSVAHEPDEEPNRLQGGGSHRREYDCCHASLDNSHTHIDDVPGHHRHFAARHFIRLMLHFSPRFRICWGWVSSCHPVCTAVSRKGACLDVFAYSATRCLCPRRAWVFSAIRRLMLMPLTGMDYFAYSAN